MVLTTEEKRERRKISDKKYRDNNKEKINQYYKKNRIELREKQAIYNIIPNSKKTKTIWNWKRYGLICEDYDSLYCHYLTANECDNCNIIFGKRGDGTATFKCMDHDHQTGLFRNFLCCSCNRKRN